MLLSVLFSGCLHHYALNNARLPMASQDRYEFESTVSRPLTVVLAEIHGDRPIWSMDIPVDHVLVVDLDRYDEIELVSVSGRPAQRMSWYLYGPDRGLPVDQGTLELPGVPVILKVEPRVAPEYPLEYAPMP